MAKLIVSLGALLYGSLGMASGVSDIRQEPPRLSLTLAADVPTEAGPQGAVTVQALASSTGRRPVVPQEMSEEEKDRRRDVCARQHDYCYDWCGRSTKFRTAERERCNKGCVDQLVDCMKQIR